MCCVKISRKYINSRYDNNIASKKKNMLFFCCYTKYAQNREILFPWHSWKKEELFEHSYITD